MKCHICDSILIRSWCDRLWLIPGNQQEFHYFNCSECGTVFCDPLPKGLELAAYYKDHFNYSWFEEHLPFKKIQAAHRWQRIASLFHKYNIRQGRLLDVGCGHGLFLSHAQRARWSTVGIDYQSLATRHAREKLGLEVVEGDLRTVILEDRLKASQFDFVTAWHCLEHVPDPLNYLEEITMVLGPSGKVLIAVPNAEALGMKLMREDWIWCQPPYVHVTHFTEKSLALLARRSGLNILATWTRDTWDAHPFFDVYVAPRMVRLLNRLRRLSTRAAFWLEEGMRLACYTASCPNHWLLGRERTDRLGSELLLLAERIQLNAK
jgi:2-polyprenyl-3-methyl-5-hydroxy-6-metoxy-1,4-benzoquinol methylase